MPSERTHMRLTIDIDTDHITADDRRVLMALAGVDAGELRITRLTPDDVERMTGGTNAVATPAPPLPVPAPAEFAAKLGEAVQQFNTRGSGSEARLPYAQQAGVRTSSTMPDDDDEPAEVVDAGAVVDPPAEVVDAGDGLVHTRWGRPEDRAPEPSDESEHDAIIRARGGVTVPRSLVEEQPPPDPGALVREAVLRQPLTAPVRHTSP